MFWVLPYVLISFLHIYFLTKRNQKGRYLTKPLLIPLLTLFYVLNENKPDTWVMLALAASFLGDVFLMKSSKLTILAGIVSFLAGHVFYILAFLEVSEDVPSWFYVWLIPYIGAGIFIGRKLFPSMDSMKIPAGIYMAVILLMSFISFTLLWSVPLMSFALPFVGSILFIISDSLLAFDMFTKKKRNNHAVIMFTYILAQFLIVLGFMV